MQRASRPFVIIFDKRFSEYAAVLMANIVRQLPNEEVIRIFTIVPESFVGSQEHHEISTALSQLPRLQWEIRTSKAFEEFAIDPRLNEEGPYPATLYLKLFIASALPESIDEIIYLDVDVVAVRELTPLLTYQIPTPFAACLELNPSFAKFILGNVDLPYFNTGVFITSLKFWRDNRAEQHMVEAVKQYGRTQFLDQDIINWFFLRVLSPLPWSFNTISKYLRSPVTSDFVVDPMIIHFAGPKEKPWETGALDIPEVGMWRDIYLKLFGRTVRLIVTPE